MQEWEGRYRHLRPRRDKEDEVVVLVRLVNCFRSAIRRLLPAVASDIESTSHRIGFNIADTPGHTVLMSVFQDVKWDFADSEAFHDLQAFSPPSFVFIASALDSFKSLL